MNNHVVTIMEILIGFLLSLVMIPLILAIIYNIVDIAIFVVAFILIVASFYYGFFILLVVISFNVAVPMDVYRETRDLKQLFIALLFTLLLSAMGVSFIYFELARWIIGISFGLFAFYVYFLKVKERIAQRKLRV